MAGREAGGAVLLAELLCKNMSKEPAPQKKEVFAVDYVAECGRVLQVVRDGNPHPDSVRTPAWCRKEQGERPSPSACG
mgnify:CR=1 FL=1